MSGVDRPVPADAERLSSPEVDSEVRVLRPPEYVEIDRPVIFLAGPVSGAPSWHRAAEEYVASTAFAGEVIVANPNTDMGSAEMTHAERTDWESGHLNLAGEQGAVMFWLPNQAESLKEGKDYAQTSRFEIGEWMVRASQGASVVLGIEEGFKDASYIRRRFSQNCPEVTIQETLNATCAEALLMSRARFQAVRERS